MTDCARLAAAERVFVEKLAAAAIQGWSEPELQEIATAAGIPLNAVREAMQALQRSEQLPAPDKDRREGRSC